MTRRRTLAMLDTLIMAGDEGLSYDGIISVPERGLEAFRNRPKLADQLRSKVPAPPKLPKRLSSLGKDSREEHEKSRHCETYNWGREGTLFDRKIDDEDAATSEEFPSSPVLEKDSYSDGDPTQQKKEDKEGMRSLVTGQVSESPDERNGVYGGDGTEKSTERTPDAGKEEESHTILPNGDQDHSNETSTRLESFPSHRCLGCRSTSENPRNLVVLIDGTSNKFGLKISNVRELSRQIDMSGNLGNTNGRKIEQRKHYISGIGAYEDDHLPTLSRAGNAVKGGFEMALAWNVEKNVKNAYEWLSENYRPGDQIYLFGFSRGAFQVRTLASMIHEVGLAREWRETERAYRTYLSVHASHAPQTVGLAPRFKKEFCWPGVRVHFLGVWDTVSSVGFVKERSHIAGSASVTTACHLRHALALDERRVKFIPEYFLEVNAHSGHKAKPTESDVKEVWFAGRHSDVGGTRVDKKDAKEPYPTHASIAPLLWMRQEAAENGLIFKHEVFTWDPLDIYRNKKRSMSFTWKLVELFPIRHQVSFDYSGQHSWWPHMSRPRSILPGQEIHSSVFSSHGYVPAATLWGGVDIPVVPRKACGKLWATELLDEEGTTQSLASLLSEHRMTPASLNKVLLHLDAWLDDQHTQIITIPEFSEESIWMKSGFERIALAVIYDVTSNFSISKDLLLDARARLCAILSSQERHPPGAANVLRLLTRHRTLRQHFILHKEVIPALVHALELACKRHSQDLFLSIMDTLPYLIEDDHLREDTVTHLNTQSGTRTGETSLLLVLGVQEAPLLVASLEMIASLARYQPGACQALKPAIIRLAKHEGSHVGSAAVAALAALNEPSTCGIPFSSVLEYLGNTLPRLDAEVDAEEDETNLDLPAILRANGSTEFDKELMHKLVRTVESHNRRQRTQATLTLLKLCHNSDIRKFCIQTQTLHIFAKQLERKKTSLLAAYALLTCLNLDMWTLSDLPLVPRLIVSMFEEGWFDDVVGRVEGFKIFGEFLKNGELRQRIVEFDIVTALVNKLGTGERYETRTSLTCLDVLREEGLTRLVNDALAKSVANILDNFYKHKMVSTKDIKILRTLAHTEGGELAIKSHAIRILDIMSSILDSEHHSVLHFRLNSAAEVLYAVFSNDVLRKHIQGQKEFNHLKSSFAAQHRA